jgi:hypothetical protein
LETEEQTLERQQVELDVLEALDEYKCDARIGSSIDSGRGVLLIVGDNLSIRILLIMDHVFLSTELPR